MPTIEPKPGHQRSELRNDKGPKRCHPNSAFADDQMDRHTIRAGSCFGRSSSLVLAVLDAAGAAVGTGVLQ
jgi:hypothetical protein